jgi:hypothetical protein
MPVDGGYGWARSVASTATPPLVAYDSFTSGAAQDPLNGESPDIGSAWVTTGTSSDDFKYVDGYVYVNDDGERFGVLGGALTGQRVYATMDNAAVDPDNEAGVVARWVDINNHLRLVVERAPDLIRLVKRLSGVDSTIATVTPSARPSIGVLLTLDVYEDGAVEWTVSGTSLFGATVGPLSSIVAPDPDLALGGVLESGKGGIVAIDSLNSTAFLEVSVSGLVTPNPACYPGQVFEVTDEGARRENEDGTAWGSPGEYIGSAFTLLPAGAAGVATRVAVIAETTDLSRGVWDADPAAKTLQVDHTPRVRVIPR